MSYSCCTPPQTFKTNYLTYLRSAFKISRNKYSIFKHFRPFRGFGLHYESVESAESWEYFVILADKRLDHFLSELKLISNLQKQKKVESGQLFTLKVTTTKVIWYKNWQRLSYSCCTVPQSFKTSYFNYLRSAFTISRRKKENFQIRSALRICRTSGKLRRLCIIITQKTGLLFIRVKTNVKSKNPVKNWIMAAFWLKVNNRGHVTQELLEIALFFLHWASGIEN